MDKQTRWIGGAVLLLIGFVAVVVKLARDSKPEYQSTDHMAKMREAKARKLKQEKAKENGTSMDKGALESEGSETSEIDQAIESEVEG